VKLAAFYSVTLCMLAVGLLARQAGAQDQAPAMPGQQESAVQTPQKEPEQGTTRPKEAVEKEMRDLRKKARHVVGDFASNANHILASVASAGATGWLVLGLLCLVGMVSLLFGWTLLQALLVPFAPVWGLLTGGVTAFCIVEAFYQGEAIWLRLTLVALGSMIGIALFLFSALRAKPVAAFLVILSPFLILAAFLFPYDQLVGLLMFCAGFAAGFAAMIEVRHLAIISTSVLGSSAMVAAVGLLNHLLGGRPEFLSTSYEWLLANPLMLAGAWALVIFVGANIQFATGPRGSLES